MVPVSHQCADQNSNVIVCQTVSIGKYHELSNCMHTFVSMDSALPTKTQIITTLARMKGAVGEYQAQGFRPKPPPTARSRSVQPVLGKAWDRAHDYTGYDLAAYSGHVRDMTRDPHNPSPSPKTLFIQQTTINRN